MSKGAVIENPFARRRSSEEAHAPAPPALRPMTGYEEEALESFAKEPNVARVCNTVLARCFVAPGAPFADELSRVHGMTILERDAALVELLALSVGDAVEHEVDCPHCGVVNVARFRLRDLPIAKADTARRLDVDVIVPSGAAAALRLPTGRDQEDLFDAQLTSAAVRKTFLLSRVLLRLDGKPGPFDPDTVHALPSRDHEAMERALDDALPELDLTMAADCVSCARQFEHPFDVTRFFFRS
jgi:hypothetical protein